MEPTSPTFYTWFKTKVKTTWRRISDKVKRTKKNSCVQTKSYVKEESIKTVGAPSSDPVSCTDNRTASKERMGGSVHGTPPKGRTYSVYSSVQTIM